METNSAPLGKVLPKIQAAFGLHPYDMAELLGIERREMSLIMLDKVAMREETKEKFHDVFGIDIFMAACCYVDASKTPEPLRNPVAKLRAQWDQMLAAAVDRFKAARN